tara:strand:+ start:381 stop:500 length:120 start_codon:yes stop_codon:yes gene_type:complete
MALRQTRTSTGAGGANVNLSGARDKQKTQFENPDPANLA